jgi:hypothetical protein
MALGSQPFAEDVHIVNLQFALSNYKHSWDRKMSMRSFNRIYIFCYCIIFMIMNKKLELSLMSILIKCLATCYPPHSMYKLWKTSSNLLWEKKTIGGYLKVEMQQWLQIVGLCTVVSGNTIHTKINVRVNIVSLNCLFVHKTLRISPLTTNYQLDDKIFQYAPQEQQIWATHYIKEIASA